VGNRIRVSDSPTLTGYKAGVSSTTPSYETHWFERSICEEDVLPGDGNYFNVRHLKTLGKWFTGVDGNGRFDQWVPTAFRNPTQYTGHATVSGRPSNSALATELLAKTNPSRANVDIPVFIAELKDLPDLVRKSGGSLIRQCADANLRYQFGLRPLIGDLTSMLNWSQLVDNRVKELEALHSGGLRRKRTLFSGVGLSSNSFIPAESGFASCNYRSNTITRERDWGFVRWYPDELIPLPKGNEKIRSQARRAVFGLTIDAVTAWELIPFSWLIDWYSSVGDYLQSKRNIVGAHPGPVLIMQERNSTLQFTRTAYDTSGGKTGKFAPEVIYKTNLEKTRWRIASPSITAKLPFLSGRQLSILGSLAILQGSGKYTLPKR